MRTPGRISIANGFARATLHPQKGRFDITPSRGASQGLLGATAGFEIAGEDAAVFTLTDCTLSAVTREDGFVKAFYRGQGFNVEIVLKKAPRPSAFIVEMALTNTSRRDILVKALLPICSDDRARLAAGFSEKAIRIYRNGWYSWDHSRVVGLMEPHTECADDDAFWEPGDRTVDVKGLVRSSGMTQVRGKGFFLTAGFLRETRQFGMLSVAARGDAVGPAFSAAALADGKPVAPGRRYRAEALYVGFSEDYNVGFSDYGSLVGEEMRARRPSEVPTGWCSWYYYYTGISDQECLANLAWLEKRRHSGIPLKVFQIDSGWQAETGDWLETNPKFPRGMKALADDIRAAGFVPGLWFAPFMVSQNSKAFRDHPDWLVAGADGSPRPVMHIRGRDLFALDLSNAEVLGHIGQVTSTICYDWGYDYIKIDFLHFGAVKGGRLDNTKTRAQNLRRGLEVIRQVAGPDKYILACGCPLGPAVGIVDGMRVSGDVGPVWEGPLSVLNSSWALTRNWMHHLLWQNDPDCILVRRDKSDLTRKEVETLANMVILSGGVWMLSDRLPDLPAERVEMLERLFPAPTTPAVPLDLYRRSRPAVYFAAGDRPLLGVFNWEDESQTFKVNLRKVLGGVAAARIRDFWTGETTAVGRGTITLNLAPHESKFFLFT